MRNPFTAIAKKVRAAIKIPQLCRDDFSRAAVRMAVEGFWLQRDPYGKAWGSTVTGMPFDKRSGLERAFKAQPGKALSFFVRCDHPAFIFHQDAQPGSRNIRRIMMPRREMGLGLWGLEFKAIAKGHFRAAMRA